MGRQLGLALDCGQLQWSEPSRFRLEEFNQLAHRRVRFFAVAFGSLTLVGGVLGLLGGLAWYKYASIMAASQQPPPPEMPTLVTIAPTSEIEFYPTVTAIGTVLAPRSITLRNEVAGLVTKVVVTSGQTVAAKQVLIELDHSVEDAMLVSAMARQRMARSLLARTQRVANENASSANEIDQAEAEMAQTNAELARLQAVIAKKTLIAPFRSKAGLLDTYVGQYLGEGTLITSLQGIDEYLYVDFMMPQTVADAVQIGQDVRLLTPEKTFVAKLIALDSIADRSTRNLMGRAKLDQPPGFLQPYDAVKVEIKYGEPRHGISIPAESLRRAPAGAFVYVALVDDSGVLRATMRPVVPGQTIGGSVIVYRGLVADEQVVVDGSFKLHEHARIMQQGSSL